MKLLLISVQHNLYFSGIKTQMRAHDSPFKKNIIKLCVRKKKKKLQQQLIITQG
jgi:hypothetical protein